MAYFDKTAVGRLVTRAVSDIETIASIFSQGLVYDHCRFTKNGFCHGSNVYVDWSLSLIVFSILPIIIICDRLFQKSMKKAFEEVRLQVANLNSFVQERLSGMKIVQIFHREKIEYDQFVSINEKHKKAWLKTVWFNSIFFPLLKFLLLLQLVYWFGMEDLM